MSKIKTMKRVLESEKVSEISVEKASTAAKKKYFIYHKYNPKENQRVFE